MISENIKKLSLGTLRQMGRLRKRALRGSPDDPPRCRLRANLVKQLLEQLAEGQIALVRQRREPRRRLGRHLEVELQIAARPAAPLVGPSALRRSARETARLRNDPNLIARRHRPAGDRGEAGQISPRRQKDRRVYPRRSCDRPPLLAAAESLDHLGRVVARVGDRSRKTANALFRQAG